MKVFLELLVGVMLWIVLSIGRRTVRAASHRSSTLQGIRPFVPAISFSVWVLYVSWLIHLWFSKSTLYPMIVFSYVAVLALLFSWFVLRDVIAGTVFSSRKQFLLDHRIQLGSLSGKIIGRGMTHLAVRTDSGDVARIPYSRLSGEVVPERSEDTASDYYRIHLSILKSDTPEQLQAALTRDVLSIPWASTGTRPIVQLKEQTETSYDFEVLFQSLNSRHAARVERILRDAYKDSR